MPWSKTTWANLIGTNTTSSVLNTNATTCGQIDCHAANKYISLAVRVSVLFQTAPNQAVDVDFYGYNADMVDTDRDTLALYSVQIPEVTTSEEIATYQLNVSALDQVSVCIHNLDTTKSVQINVAWMAGYW